MGVIRGVGDGAGLPQRCVCLQTHVDVRMILLNKLTKLPEKHSEDQVKCVQVNAECWRTGELRGADDG